MTTQEKISIMQAWCDGKQIEMREVGCKKWISAEGEPAWNWIKLNYRIKPEPKEPTYRPYANFDEFRAEWEKHGGWTINELNCYSLINYIITSPAFDFFRGLVEKYRWADDGLPCGIKVEE